MYEFSDFLQLMLAIKFRCNTNAAWDQQRGEYCCSSLPSSPVHTAPERKPDMSVAFVSTTELSSASFELPSLSFEQPDNELLCWTQKEVGGFTQ